jgi:hypothetical protein
MRFKGPSTASNTPALVDAAKAPFSHALPSKTLLRPPEVG